MSGRRLFLTSLLAIIVHGVGACSSLSAADRSSARQEKATTPVLITGDFGIALGSQRDYAEDGKERKGTSHLLPWAKTYHVQLTPKSHVVYEITAEFETDKWYRDLEKLRAVLTQKYGAADDPDTGETLTITRGHRLIGVDKAGFTRRAVNGRLEDYTTLQIRYRDLDLEGKSMMELGELSAERVHARAMAFPTAPVDRNPPPPGARRIYELVPTTTTFDADAARQSDGEAPFVLHDRGPRATVETPAGLAIYRAPKEQAIYDLWISPNGKRFVVNTGSFCDLVTPGGAAPSHLPPHPPGKKMLGFSTWSWLNEDQLLTLSAHVLSSKGEEPLTSGSLLYLYDLTSRDLSPVTAPAPWMGKHFRISAVDPSGNVQLTADENVPTAKDPKPAWYKVQLQPVK